MLHFLPSPDDVIALTIADKVTSADVDAVIDRMEVALEKHDKVHVFMEARSIDGLEISGLGGHIARAMPMMAKLRRFGRIAVVADQAWMRVGVRVESALLPFVGYRVFKPEQRAQAHEWVMKGPSSTHG